MPKLLVPKITLKGASGTILVSFHALKFVSFWQNCKIHPALRTRLQHGGSLAFGIPGQGRKVASGCRSATQFGSATASLAADASISSDRMRIKLRVNWPYSSTSFFLPEFILVEWLWMVVDAKENT